MAPPRTKTSPRARPRSAWEQSQHVHVAAAGQDRGLPFHGLFHGADLVAQHGGLFEFQGFRSGFHAAVQFLEQGVGLALQKVTDAAHAFEIVLGRDQAHAGGRALAI